MQEPARQPATQDPAYTAPPSPPQPGWLGIAIGIGVFAALGAYFGASPPQVFTLDALGRKLLEGAISWAVLGVIFGAIQAGLGHRGWKGFLGGVATIWIGIPAFYFLLWAIAQVTGPWEGGPRSAAIGAVFGTLVALGLGLNQWAVQARKRRGS
jgi:hypothetical protein